MVTSMSYDAAGQVNFILLPDGATGNDTRSVTNYYDSFGRLYRTDKSANDSGQGLVTEFKFDRRDNMTGMRIPSVTNGSTTETTSEYDDQNRVIRSIGHDPTLSSDTAGELHTKKLITEFIYNEVGVQEAGVLRRIESYPEGESTDYTRKTEYTYDHLGQTTEITATAPNNTDPPTQKYEYDLSGNRTKLTIEFIEDTQTKTLVTDQHYDAYDQIRRIQGPVDADGYRSDSNPYLR